MPQRNSVYTLPEPLQKELNQRLIDTGFGGYVGLSEWLDEQGYAISKSAIHRYGIKFKREHEALLVATEQAKVLAETIPDDEGAMAEALTRVAQNKLYDCLVGLDVEAYLDEEKVENLPKLIGAIAKLNQSSVNLKKYQNEVRAKLKAANEEIEKVARRSGTSDTGLDRISEILKEIV